MVVLPTRPGAASGRTSYRIAVLTIELAPLGERPEDIRWLAERLLQNIAVEQGRPVAVSENFVRDLLARPWKGNVRELRSHLEQAVVLSEAGVLDVEECSAPSRSEALDDASGELMPLQSVVADTPSASTSGV